jgi:Bacterial Ig domain
LSDGTNVTSGVVELSVAPLVTSPLLIPVAVQTEASELPGLVANGNVKDVLSNATYTFSNPIVAPGDGTVKFTNANTGTLTYTPPSDTFFGVVQVTYTVTDSALKSATGTVIINVEETIRPSDDGPISAVAGRALTILPGQILGNDVAAPDGLKPSIGSVGNAVNGKVVLNGDGSVTFTPTYGGPASFDYTDTDADRDASLAATVTLNVKYESTITWANPSGIVYGTPLSGLQLDAYANVPGTLTYSPPAGTYLHVGSGQTLSVVFTPSDASLFTDASATVSINVGPAPPPGLSVVSHSFSGRVRRKIGGVIAQLHTALSRLKPTYYSALINWDDGDIQGGRLTKSGAHGFKLNASHTYRVRGSYLVSVTISDPLGNSLTESFEVFVH